jgi:hypothetical protein
LLVGCRRSPHVAHHAAQATAVALVLVALLLLSLVGFCGLAYLIVYHEGLYRKYELSTVELVLLGILFGPWALLWLTGVVLTLAGSSRGVPLIGRLTRWRRLAWAANVALVVFVAAVAVLAIHASAITR